MEESTEQIKKLGHNKFQLEIEELKKEIESHIYTNNEKEMKLSLFKQNISNLQKQLQECHLKIQTLEESVNPIIEKDDSLLLNEIETLKKEIVSKEYIINSQKESIDTLNENNKLLENKYEILYNESLNIKTTIDKHIASIQNLNETVVNLEAKNIQLTNNNTNLENELLFVKDSLVKNNELLKLNKEQLYELLEKEQKHEEPEQIIEQTIPIGIVRKKLTRNDRTRRK